MGKKIGGSNIFQGQASTKDLRNYLAMLHILLIKELFEGYATRRIGIDK